MNNSLSLILLLTTTTLAFAQGKLCFCNNTDNLIYFTTDNMALRPGDETRTANGTGAAFPIAGSGLYTGAGSTIAALAGSPTFVAALYGGTSAGSLSLQTTTTIDGLAHEGQVVPVNVTLFGLPAGTPAFFQIQVYDSRASSALAAWYTFSPASGSSLYAGESPIFQATPEADVYSPIYLPSPSPVNSTWAPGTSPVLEGQPQK